MVRIPIDQPRLAAFCRRNHIRRLAFFGSVVRDDFRSESDVDVMVEFEPRRTPGWDIIAMEDDLGEILGRKVDLNARDCLSPYFREEALAEAEVAYEQA
ncbi:MAG: nucleotidyltransferase family protein [Candidatus Sumerlaeota bacterium]|nr:nucleotidyltransferase family protein [Candidatus Sumerlaeota bacterium]